MSYLIDNGHKIKQPDAPFAVQLLNISKVCHNGVNCPTNRTDIARNRIHVFDMKHATIGMYRPGTEASYSQLSTSQFRRWILSIAFRG